MKLSVFIFCLILGKQATALEFTVDTTEDTIDVDVIDGLCEDINGHCSLRAAIMQTNRFATDDVIYLPRNEIFTLNLVDAGVDSEQVNDLDIRDTLTLSIVDPETPVTSFAEIPQITAGLAFNDRIFELQNGGNITFYGIGITHGNAQNSAVNERRGGGVYVAELVTEFHLIHSYVAFNQAAFGAGIYSAAQSTWIESSDVSYNTAIIPAAIVLGAGGAGIYHVGDSFTLSKSSVHHNYTNEDNGFLLSALSLNGVDSTVNVLNSLVADNGQLTGSTSSVIDGISANQANVFINNSNISTNTRYGMRFSSNNNHVLTMRNSVLSHNENANCGVMQGIQDFGEELDPAHIVSSDLSCDLSELAMNIEGVDPELSDVYGSFNILEFSFFMLQYPLDGSVLIDSGHVADVNSGSASACEPKDIRGVSRPQHGGINTQCDIGAFEVADLIFKSDFSALESNEL
ncbi:choice-of-anchor Q domain-containing protein [Marinicella litoralis]|uniref:CSLREA domain-containing protein n=1 Tax=Marinicella litoralis TaxID=644220 RepID=A0A4R6XDW0_9GAMM|nr:choice-of-anchor Q domain-containing protein [Marinicella litoralis]TDR17515.1 hypothetical protein C8D91_2574 [Marinicella litoralis]